MKVYYKCLTEFYQILSFFLFLASTYNWKFAIWWNKITWKFFLFWFVFTTYITFVCVCAVNPHFSNKEFSKILVVLYLYLNWNFNNYRKAETISLWVLSNSYHKQLSYCYKETDQ